MGPLQKYLYGQVKTLQHQATTSDFHSTISLPHPKSSSFEVSDDVIACDLWFALPIKHPGYTYNSGSRFSTCFFFNCFQQLEVTGFWLTYAVYHMLSSIKHSNIIAKYSNIFCNNTSILKAIAESLR